MISHSGGDAGNAMGNYIEEDMFNVREFDPQVIDAKRASVEHRRRTRERIELREMARDLDLSAKDLHDLFGDF